MKNPNGGEEVTHRSPQEIMDEIAALDAESAEVLETIRGAAMKSGWQRESLVTFRTERHDGFVLTTQESPMNGTRFLWFIPSVTATMWRTEMLFTSATDGHSMSAQRSCSRETIVLIRKVLLESKWVS